MLTVAARARVPDVLRLLIHHPSFGGAFCTLLHEALRGPSFWSAGERELFAAFTSHVQRCQF